MSEVWLLKTYDGEEYPLRTDGVCFYDVTYESIYNLLKEVEGHHGITRVLLSNALLDLPGEELYRIKEEIRTQYLPLRITGATPADFHKNMEKLRKSLVNGQVELWITNEEGDTRVLYCTYKSGFDKAIDGSKRGRNWISVPLYLQANDPYFYDQPGMATDNLYVQSPWNTDFLTKSAMYNLADFAGVPYNGYNKSGSAYLVFDENPYGLVVSENVEIISEDPTDATHKSTYRETHSILGITNPATATYVVQLNGALTHSYVEANQAYVIQNDDDDVFLNPDSILETSLTADTTIAMYAITVADTSDCVVGDLVTVIDQVKNIREENTVAEVTSGTILTLTNQLSNSYLLANKAFIVVNRRVVNDNCNLIVYWLTGCPPCYRAIAQLQALKAAYSNLTITYVEITRASSSSNCPSTGLNCIGMTQATTGASVVYPEGYAFSQACGPQLPSFYGAIGTIMPAVITLYRNGRFITGWCGVHTTNVDAVSSDTILDACGSKMSWRIGQEWIGYKVPINNTGDTISYPRWTIYGPGHRPRLKNITTGYELELAHDLLEGEVVVIDSRDIVDTAHTCASNRDVAEFVAGYNQSEICPTCHGTGVISSDCESCGGTEICPSCHGTGKITIWVPDTFGDTSLIGGMFNLREELVDTSQSFWGFEPNVNVVQIDMSRTDVAHSKIELQLLSKYEGI
jgi:thiol-disulfide isomerase/thioredoxin